MHVGAHKTAHSYVVKLHSFRHVFVVLFPGFHLWNVNIEVVQVWRAVFFVTWKASKLERGVCGRTQRLRAGKRAKVAETYNTYLAIRSWILHTLWVECIVGWATRKTLPFCSGPILITSCLWKRLRYQALSAYTYLRSGRARKQG